jgi:hypothetical protein
MSDAGINSFRHDQSGYERPTLGWRCGRAANWNMPCKRGPSAQGVCGGQNTCAPLRSGEKWQCRRSAAEGGPCPSGPGADGSCGLRRPPCVPRRTLSVWRGRLSVLAIGFVLAVVAILAYKIDATSGAPTSLDPGPLSAPHSHFAGTDACSTCHTAFGGGTTGWWRAFWSPAALMPEKQPGDTAAHRLSAACTECHSFGGFEEHPHNRNFETRTDLGPTDCLMCHTEHKGRLATITKLSQAQCQSCHTRPIKDFAVDHPQFAPKFPYEHLQAITFDHANHFNKYFSQPGLKAQVPPGGCIGCHEIGDGGRALQPAKFEGTCSNCHADAIAKKDFILFRWPEIDNNDIKPDEIAKSCGASAVPPPPKTEPGKPAPAFSGVSADPLNLMSAYLLDTTADSAADYEKPVQDLARDMMANGADPLVDAVASHLPNAKKERLFSGLDSEQVRQAACAWAGNQEYSQPGQTAVPGWRADDLDLRYTHPSHADPVVKAWLDALASAPMPSDDDAAARMVRARREILSFGDGPGLCTKCHAVSGQRGGPLTVSWQVQLGTSPQQTRFDHRPHLDLLGPEKTCTSCHKLADSVLSVENTGLKGIALDTCEECHAAGKVRDDCQTCHVYHQGHAFRKRMMQDAM